MSLDPALRRAITDRVRYYNDLGIYDFYRRPVAPEIAGQLEEYVARAPSPALLVAELQLAQEESLPKPKSQPADHATALRLIREDLGDCTRCRLHKQGRKQIVFGVGNPNARTDVHRRSPGRGRRRARRAFRRTLRPIADQHDQGHGPAPRRRLHRQHHQVPPARQSHARAR